MDINKKSFLSTAKYSPTKRSAEIKSQMRQEGPSLRSKVLPHRKFGLFERPSGLKHVSDWIFVVVVK